MKAENRTSRTKKPRIHRPPEAKVVAAAAWAPQPCPLTRAEIQKLVIDQIG